MKFVGQDINVTGVWERNITGKGVTVSVIDDGMFQLFIDKIVWKVFIIRSLNYV